MDDTEGHQRDPRISDLMAKARARRETRTTSGGVLWYEEGDPRLLLTSGQIPALPMIIRGLSIDGVAVALRRSPRRVKRWMGIPRFRAALEKERAEPSSWQLLLQAGLTDPASASERLRKAHEANDFNGDGGGSDE